jgi:hypothetical protein
MVFHQFFVLFSPLVRAHSHSRVRVSDIVSHSTGLIVFVLPDSSNSPSINSKCQIDRCGPTGLVLLQDLTLRCPAVPTMSRARKRQQASTTSSAAPSRASSPVSVPEKLPMDKKSKFERRFETATTSPEDVLRTYTRLSKSSTSHPPFSPTAEIVDLCGLRPL